jgi:hypothetical protein
MINKEWTMPYEDILTTGELYRLRDARSEAEWNAICDDVKRSRGGRYPADWYAKVVLSGLAQETANHWGPMTLPEHD